MNSFCAGLYNETITLFGGWAYIGAVTNAYTSTNAQNPWTEHILSYHPLNAQALNLPAECVQFENDPFLYTVPAKIRITSTDVAYGEYLVVYNLETQSFVNMSSYNSTIPFQSHPGNIGIPKLGNS